MALKSRAHESDLRSGGANRRQEPYTSHLIDVLPLVEPYKGNGKLSVRIENLPHKARFSAGARASEKSWSLTFDDLKGLNYLLPEGVDPDHTVTIRVIGLERGDTLGVLNVKTGELYAEEDDTPPPAPAPRAKAGASKTDSIQNQLAATKNSLNSLEGQLADALSEIKRLTLISSEKADIEAERAKWKAEEAARLKEVNARWQAQMQEVTAQQKSASADLQTAKAASQELEAAKLAELKRHWKAEADARLRDSDARWQTQIQELTEQLDAALAKAEAAQKKTASADISNARAAWKEEEAGRLAAMQRSWKVEETARLQEVNDRWQLKLQELTAQRDAALAKVQTTDTSGEIRILRETITSLQTTLVDRETALMRASKALDAEKLQRRHDADEYHRMQQDAQQLEQERQDELAQSLAQAEAQLKKHYAQEMQRLTSRAESAEAALADQRRVAAERSHHENELIVLRDALAAREAELQREHEKLVNTTDALRQNEQHGNGSNMPRSQDSAPKYPSFVREIAVGVICTVATILVLPEFRGWFAPAPVIVEAPASETVEVPVAQTLMRTVSVLKTTRLRNGPSKSERAIVRAEKGTEVSLLESGETWSRVKMNYKTKSVEGWIENTSLDLGDKP